MPEAPTHTCARCRSLNAAGARFCRSCGTLVEASAPDAASPVSLTKLDTPSAPAAGCPSCATHNDPAARFCRGCGSTLGAPAPGPVPGPRAHAAPPTAVRPLVATPPPPTARAPAPPPAPARSGGALKYVALGLLVFLVAGGSAFAAISLLKNDDKTPEPVAQTQSSGAVADATTQAATTQAAPATTESAPAPDPGVLPDGPDEQFADEIRGLLLDFHRQVVARDYRAAWDLLTDRKRGQFTREDGYQKWRAAQATLTPNLDPEGVKVRVVELDRATGVARVKVTGMDWSARNARCSEWSGITWARYEDGAWRYDPGYSTTPQRRKDWKRRYAELLGGSC